MTDTKEIEALLELLEERDALKADAERGDWELSCIYDESEPQ